MKKILLVGNANTGKTTLLNSLTKSFEHTGNWHGVTVEEKEKYYFFQDEEIVVVDLPGIYSLNSLSFEEQVSIDYIFKNQYDLIINTCDINTLNKNLFLTLDLLLSGKTNILLAINTMDKKTTHVDTKKIKTELGVDSIVINFSNAKDIVKLKSYVKKFVSPNNNIDYFNKIFSKETNNEINILNKKFNIEKYKLIKIIEKNIFFIKKINKNNYFFNYLNNFCKINDFILAKEKYSYIDSLGFSYKNKKVYGKEILDKVFLNNFFAIPIFLLIMLGIFYITFFSVGAWLSEIISNFVQGTLGTIIVNWLESFCKIPWLVSLIEDGFFAGVGSLISFLPQVVLLFVFLAILEDTGYFSRIAFIFEDVASSVGLSGKSIYTLLMGFGCSASAVLTTRAMDNKNSKIKTALITPYMSCSAKLPVYAILGGAFFGASNVWVIFLLYIIGVFTALLVSSILDKLFFKNNQISFIQEFPPYRFPKMKKICQIAWQNLKLFLIKVTTIFISMNIIVWCLSNFTFSFQYVANCDGKSILQCLGEFFAPFFAPLGFDNWGAVSALIAGIVAKEIIVSSLAIFNGINIGVTSSNDIIANSLKDSNSVVFFTSESALSYLSFCLLYSPCLATMAVMKKEIGWKWTLIGVGIQLIVAYIMAFIVFNLYNLMNIIGILNLILLVCIVLLIIFSIFHFFDYLKQKNKCKLCGKCNF